METRGGGTNCKNDIIIVMQILKNYLILQTKKLIKNCLLKEQLKNIQIIHINRIFIKKN